MNRPVMFLGLFTFVGCQPGAPPQQAQTPPGPPKGSPEWKIQNAMSAAPDVIAKGAAVMDFGATPDAGLVQLRPGTNGWTCLPDMPDSPGNDPICVDQTFMTWVGAWIGHTNPVLKNAGFAYMLQGAWDASNTDPFKMKPDSGQQWVVTGPHVMMVVPNPAALAGMSTDHTSGMPYIMFQGTPYAHVMLPVK